MPPEIEPRQPNRPSQQDMIVGGALSSIDQSSSKTAINTSEIIPILKQMGISALISTLIQSIKGDKGDPGAQGAIGPPGPMGRPGLNGYDGRDGMDAPPLEVIVTEVLPFIPKPKDGMDGQDGSPDSGSDIVRKINLLSPEDVKIEASQIANLPLAINRTITKIGVVPYGGSSAGVATGSYFYFGDSGTNGSWRMGQSGDNLVVERREGGVWVQKSAFLAS